jgi:hypothetical protein
MSETNMSKKMNYLKSRSYLWLSVSFLSCMAIARAEETISQADPSTVVFLEGEQIAPSVIEEVHPVVEEHVAPVEVHPVVEEHVAPVEVHPVVEEHVAPVEVHPVVGEHVAPVEVHPVVEEHVTPVEVHPVVEEHVTPPVEEIHDLLAKAPIIHSDDRPPFAHGDIHEHVFNHVVGLAENHIQNQDIKIEEKDETMDQLVLENERLEERIDKELGAIKKQNNEIIEKLGCIEKNFLSNTSSHVVVAPAAA